MKFAKVSLAKQNFAGTELDMDPYDAYRSPTEAPSPRDEVRPFPEVSVVWFMLGGAALLSGVGLVLAAAMPSLWPQRISLAVLGCAVGALLGRIRWVQYAAVYRAEHFPDDRQPPETWFRWETITALEALCWAAVFISIAIAVRWLFPYIEWHRGTRDLSLTRPAVKQFDVEQERG